VTRGQLTQRAGLPGLNGGGAAAAVPPHYGGILAVNVKFYSMNKTVKIHQNPADTSEYDAIKRGKQ